MSTLKAQRRPKARKEKLIDVGEHKLTPEQYQVYLSDLNSRRVLVDQQENRIRKLALGTVWYRESAKGQADDIFKRAHKEAGDALSDLHALHHFPWHNGDPKIIEAGRSILRIAAEKCLRAHTLLQGLDQKFADDETKEAQS